MALPPLDLARLRTATLLVLLVTVATGLVFAIWPQLDLVVAAWFYGGHAFALDDGGLGGAVRRVGVAVPVILAVGTLALYAAKRFGFWHGRAPSGRLAITLILALAIGPGLLINTLLKDHSHRPRPAQVTEFGGVWHFVPWYRFDGECRRNCSFVSGEESSAMWTVAPALEIPGPWQPVAVGAALVFAAVIGTVRMAFGGHFLSDTIFSGCFTLLIILAARWASLRWARRAR